MDKFLSVEQVHRKSVAYPYKMHEKNVYNVRIKLSYESIVKLFEKPCQLERHFISPFTKSIIHSALIIT